ncbi:unnamed protein product, partial [Staurois parvus]
HSQSWVLHSRGRGREHSTHCFLCFHCTQLLSSLTAPSASNRSGPEFRVCSARRPWGHTHPTIISTRHWQADEWKFQGLIIIIISFWMKWEWIRTHVRFLLQSLP